MSAVCVLCVGGAVYSFLAIQARDLRRRHPDTADTRTTWVCNDCGHEAAFTARELFDARVAGSEVSRDTREDGGHTSRRTMTLICPSCQALTLRRGSHCHTCGESFLPSRMTIGVHCEACSRELDVDKKKTKKQKAGGRRP